MGTYHFKKFFRYLVLFGLIILVIYLFSLKNNNNFKPYNLHKPVSKQTGGAITGLEAGTGMMNTTQKAIKAYSLNKDGWQLQSTSTPIMLSQLNKAIKHHQPIVIIGWTPHWMFIKYKLKFLSDPKKIYGNGEHEDTITRTGFKFDNPGAYKFLKNYYMKLNKIQPILAEIKDGKTMKTAIKEYIKENPHQIKQWLKGVPQGHGKKFSLGLQPATDGKFTAELVKKVLKSRGYQVSERNLDSGIMWVGLASGPLDATICAELPVTQHYYAKKYQSKFDHVKINLKHLQVGLTVPKYMKNINSINDLKNSD